MWLRGLLLTLVLIPLLGCGPWDQHPAPRSDPAKARQVLTQTLDAWRSGATPESLRENEPSVIANDHDWQAGLQLVRYEIQQEGQPFGNRVRFQTALEVRDASGRAQPKAAEYIVATEPIVTVRRNDEEEQVGGGLRRSRRE